MTEKIAIVTGIGGQAACYMARLLLDKGYTVYGTVRPNTNYNFWRLKEENIVNHSNLKIVQVDMNDSPAIFDLVNRTKPELFINLAAISSVGDSFNSPIISCQIDGIGPLYCLEAIRQVSPKTKFYQASTSEMFGNTKTVTGILNEDSIMEPVSPYASAKLMAYNLTKIYRRSYDLFCCSSILFNNGSKYRGEYFIERKIGKYVAELKMGLNKDYLYLGNLNASRDLGHTADYVEGIYLSLIQDKPDNYVFATGSTTCIREMLNIAFRYIGEDWKHYVKTDKQYLRPNELHFLLGDATKAKEKLGWKPTRTIYDIFEEIIEADISRLKNENIKTNWARTMDWMAN